MLCVIAAGSNNSRFFVSRANSGVNSQNALHLLLALSHGWLSSRSLAHNIVRNLASPASAVICALPARRNGIPPFRNSSPIVSA